jgi:hypothetical protein
MPRDDLDLPRVKRKIYDAVSRYPGITAERLCALVWDDPSGGPESGRKAVHVHVHGLNKLIARYGVEVRGSVTGGYHVRFHQSRVAKGGRR